MAAITNQIIPSGGFNNIGAQWITPISSGQNIIVADDNVGTNKVCEFDVTNRAILVDLINEVTATAGVTIDSVLIKDGGMQMANNVWLAAKASGGGNYNLVRYTDGDALAVGSAANWRTALDAQQQGDALDDIKDLSPTNNYFIAGNGAAWVLESPSAVRTSLGLGDMALEDTINNSNWSGTDLSVTNGGTAAGNPDDARANLVAAKSGSNSDITALTNCGELSDNGVVAINTVGDYDVLFKRNSIALLVFDTGATVRPGIGVHSNLGSATEYFNGFHIATINFVGSGSAGAPGAATGKIAIQIDGVAKYIAYT